MKNALLVILTLVGCFALMGGCASAETTSTKEQEEAFRNPSKEPPAGMAEGMEKAAEAGRAGKQTETR